MVITCKYVNDERLGIGMTAEGMNCGVAEWVECGFGDGFGHDEDN